MSDINKHKISKLFLITITFCFLVSCTNNPELEAEVPSLTVNEEQAKEEKSEDIVMTPSEDNPIEESEGPVTPEGNPVELSDNQKNESSTDIGKDSKPVVKETVTAPKPVPNIPVETPKPVSESKPVIVIKEERKEMTIPFKVLEEIDGTLEKGIRKTEVTGSLGTEVIVFKITYTDGKETSREEVSRSVTKEPVNEIIKIGSKEPLPPVASKAFEENTALGRAILEETNKQRAAHGLSALEWRDSLAATALSHNIYLLENNLFEHTKIYNVGENLYRLGSKDTSKHNAVFIVGKWMDSPGHKANILHPDYKYFGCSVIVGEQYYPSVDRILPTLYATQHFVIK